MADDNPSGQIREGDSAVQPLPQDNSTPFSPPVDPVADDAAPVDARPAAGQLDPTHPATDSAGNVDPTQAYNEGPAAAAEAVEPNTENAVTDFTPPQPPPAPAGEENPDDVAL